MKKTMEKNCSTCKNRGFVYQVQKFYGGLSNTWDYGNLGVELKNNVKRHGGRNLFRKTLIM